jgi:CheY-like chemotaxis protein
VLLVEDDDDTRSLLGMVLRRHGAEVTSVSSTNDALRILVRTASGSDRVEADPVSTETGTEPADAPVLNTDSHSFLPPDVIISDIGMAEQDGYELMRKVRALPPEEGGLVPAIALTGYAARKDRERALAAGYQLHVAKPVEPDELVAAIAKLVRRRQ